MEKDTPGHTINDLDKMPPDQFAKHFSGVQVDETGYVQQLRDEGLMRNPNDPAQRQYMQSTSDQRTTNNVMRHQYRVLDENEKANMQAIKDMGLQFHDMLSNFGESRELSLAKTKIEEAVMWATKHITR